MRGDPKSGPATDPMYYLEPHDSNLHIWHLVLRDPETSLEFYMVLYISDSDSDSERGSNFNAPRVTTNNGYSSSSPVIMLRCMTPNSSLTLHRNVSLGYWSSILLKEGLVSFVRKVHTSFFAPIKRVLSDYDNNSIKHHNIQYLSHLLKAWNCIMCKDYKLYFPELVTLLQPGDYQRVRDLARWLQSIQRTHFGCYNLTTGKDVHFPSQLPPSLLPFLLCSHPNDFFNTGLSEGDCIDGDYTSVLHPNPTLFCYDTLNENGLCNSNSLTGRHIPPYQPEVALFRDSSPLPNRNRNTNTNTNNSNNTLQDYSTEPHFQQSPTNQTQTSDLELDTDSSDDGACSPRKRMKI